MPASVNDKLIKGARKFGTNLAATIADGTVNSMSLVLTTGLPTDTAVELTIDRVDANGNKTPSKEEVVRGVVSGTSVINLVRGVEGTAQGHSTGAVVEARLTADQWNRMVDWGLTEHNQDGTHNKITNLANNQAITQKDSGGAARSILRLGNDNSLYLGGTGISKIVVQSQFDGWVFANETWTYDSATTFTVAGDLTSRYVPGVKIKLTQNSTVKYFYVVSSSFSTPNTTVTITGGSSYTFTNHAVTENFYSWAENPFGFPSYLEFSPTFAASGGGASLGNGTCAGRFSLRGRQVRGMIYFEVGSATNQGAGAFLWGLPLTGATTTFQGNWTRLGLAQTGVNNNTLGVVSFNGSSRTQISANSYTGTGLWQAGVPGTWSTGSQAWLFFEYEI